MVAIIRKYQASGSVKVYGEQSVLKRPAGQLECSGQNGQNAKPLQRGGQKLIVGRQGNRMNQEILICN